MKHKVDADKFLDLLNAFHKLDDAWKGIAWRVALMAFAVGAGWWAHKLGGW